MKAVLSALLVVGVIGAPGCRVSRRSKAKPVESTISEGKHDRKTDDPRWIETRKDVDWVLRKLARIMVAWDFVTPVERHGPIAGAVLAEEARAGMEFRRHALMLLGFAGHDSPEALAALQEAVQDTVAVPGIRYEALLSLGQLGHGAKSSLPLLGTLYRNPEWHFGPYEGCSQRLLEATVGRILRLSASGKRESTRHGHHKDHILGLEWLQAQSGAEEPIHPSAEAGPKLPPAPTLTLDCGGGVMMEFVLIPAGEFTMGSPAPDSVTWDKRPQHQVKFLKPFYMARHEVTQAQYQAVMGTNPSHFKGADLPVDTVSWYDATEFCRRLEERVGRRVRLPTEAKWEYACRAGTTTRYHFGDSADDLGKHAWYWDNSGEKTHAVGGKPPNAWGLHDMHGNVFEWCIDRSSTYPSARLIDPSQPGNKHGYSEWRIMRGGSWGFASRCLGSADRYGDVPGARYNYYGFRVVTFP